MGVKVKLWAEHVHAPLASTPNEDALNAFLSQINFVQAVTFGGFLLIFYEEKKQSLPPSGIEVPEGNTESKELKRVPLYVFD